MAPLAVAAPEPTWSTHERPWLVPWNRRLRHLRSIVVRNLSLSISHARTRTRSNDDEALPNSLKSPAKLLALQEEPSLVHWRSSDDLRDKKQVNGAHKVVNKEKRVRPDGLKLRRRSTLDWASASPQTRQKRMEDVSAARLADAFFSLHISGVKEPIYVSETITKTMNPTFQNLNLEDCGPGITRMDKLCIKVWVRGSKQRAFSVLIEMVLSLRSLQFIGRRLADFNHPFPQNCIVFELSDGFYTCFTDVQGEEPPNPFLDTRFRANNPRTLATASFDALLRLSKLDDNVQDALALRKRLSADLAAVTGASQQAFRERDQVHEIKDYCKTIDYARSTVEKQVKNLRHSLETKRAALLRRRELLSQGREVITKGTRDQPKFDEDMEQLQEELIRSQRAITNQRRRISDDLGAIYPLAAVPNKTLAFTIRGIHLPDSQALESSTPEQLAAALGYVAHMLQLLAFYLRQSPPYPPHPRLSTSIMTDPISSLKQPNNGSATSGAYHESAPRSLSDPTRSFPLYPKGSGPSYRFEYAIFLLNKDLHVLLSDAFGVRVLDIRQTLPNLMYILACMAAGEGELPSRKAGGVRGLMKTAQSSDPVTMKQSALSTTTTLIGSPDSDSSADFKRLRRTARNIYSK